MPNTKTARKAPRRNARGGKKSGVSSPRARLRRLVDELPEDKLRSVLDYAAYLRDAGDPLRRDVEEVDESLTPEEIAGIEEGRRECREGKGIPWEEARRKLARA